nr:glycoside hydrolase family 3 N-terminal domain-containing protein [Natrinema sp. SYSU A 869]
MGPEGTTFPQMIGMASTWSPDLLKTVTDTVWDQLEDIGTAHVLPPVLDVARDLRWGRVEETFGEDPYLVAAMACGYVDGLQGDGDGVSATLKHFVGHGAGEGGKNRSSVNLGRRELLETHLFPFEAAIQTADAESVMNAYHDVDGVPCASDEWLLTDVLRREWGFDGTVVSDYYSVEFLRSEHGVAADDRIRRSASSARSRTCSIRSGRPNRESIC